MTDKDKTDQQTKEENAKKKKQDRELDEELKDTFPASDPIKPSP